MGRSKLKTMEQHAAITIGIYRVCSNTGKIFELHWKKIRIQKIHINRKPLQCRKKFL